jgi:hypothetical protein
MIIDYCQICLFLQSDVYNLAAGLLETANNVRKINYVFLRVKRGLFLFDEYSVK